jgi:hypothetical protein
MKLLLEEMTLHPGCHSRYRFWRASASLKVTVSILLVVWQLTFVKAQSVPPPMSSHTHVTGVTGERAGRNQDEEYVGNEACRSCHQQEVDGYIGSAHALASSFPSERSISGRFNPGANILNTSNQYLYFIMQSRKEGFFQTAVVNLPLSESISRTERIDIVVGAGRKGQTYLSWANDRLFELPVSYWTESNRWINSPGYVDGFPNFDKVIVPRCLECHATYFQSLPPPLNRFDKSKVDLGITCEKCHGPGRAHIVLNRSHSPPRRGQPQAVLNPASFSRDRQMDLCSLCHAGPGSSLKPSFSFKPEEDIHKYISLSEESANQALDVHGSQVQLLESSRCFKASKMTCTTCHNVHLQQREAASFSKTCLRCHRVESCGKYRTIGDTIANDCISCHMPLQLTNQIVFDTDGLPVRPRIRNHKIAIYAQVPTPNLRLDH